LFALVTPAAHAQGLIPRDDGGAPDQRDDIPGPLGELSRGSRSEALQAHVAGHDPDDAGQPHRDHLGQFVELAREGEDPVWTLLVEFGDAAPIGGLPGPRHNETPQPDPALDNTFTWVPDFNPAYYEDLLFGEGPDALSLRAYWIENSSGRYAIYGDVVDWVPVPFNTATYGRDRWACGEHTCTSELIADATDVWWQREIDSGKTPEEIDAYLAQFDVWDRYDHDGDGNFGEPDGYIDRFQIVHAGTGEEGGGGIYGVDAIWSHATYAYPELIGITGPEGAPLGGHQIGDSHFWIGNYLTVSENAPVGLFAHEYGHDLGLPDLYDPNVDNSVVFWSLMSVGSYTFPGQEGPLGALPTHLMAWEKLQLDWLDYEVAAYGMESQHTLGPIAGQTSGGTQAVIIPLPGDPQYAELGPAYAGSKFFWSGQGNGLFNWMLKPFTVDAAARLTAKVRFDIETDWDYAYVVYEYDGYLWILDTNLSTDTNPHGQNFGYGITGSTDGQWVDLDVDLGPAIAAVGGDGVVLGFAYLTDQDVIWDGLSIDELTVSGNATDGAEEESGWSFSGFKTSEGTEQVGGFFHAYLAENRQYIGFDDGLRGAYWFGDYDLEQGIAWSDTFAYQEGMLVTYWNTEYQDNFVSMHPGRGMILPVDAHPEPFGPYFDPWWTRVTAYDATFHGGCTDGLTLTDLYGNTLAVDPPKPGIRFFDDTRSYWSDSYPNASVILPNTGTTIRIDHFTRGGFYMDITVNGEERIADEDDPLACIPDDGGE